MMRIDLYKIKKKGMQVAVVTTGALLMSFICGSCVQRAC